MKDKNEHRIDRFLECLGDYVKRSDNGALADLRRGFSAATENRAWPYLAGWCDLTDFRERIIWQTLAAGFAVLKHTDSKAGNMGATLRNIAISGAKDKKEALKSFGGRFRRLLTCHEAKDVCERLPGVFRMAEQKGVRVNFRSLFWDLVCWRSDKRDVKVEWAAAYWNVLNEKQENVS